MNGRQFTFGASGNPLVQVVSLLVFGVFAVAAVIMGAFVLLAFLGVAIIGFVVLSVRGWWLRRKLRGRAAPFAAERPPPGGVERGARLIEAEYVVVKKGDAADPPERGPR